MPHALKRLTLRQWHSLSGIVPLSVFLIAHVATSTQALRGEAVYAQSVAAPSIWPYVEWAILVPLAFHGVLGLMLLWEGRLSAPYPYPHDRLWVLQRVSGTLAFFFIIWHFFELRGARAFGTLSSDSFYTVLTARLSSTTWGIPLVALAYLVGLTATIFHFANGLFGFLVRFGIAASRAARLRAAIASGALGLVLFVSGGSTLLFLATGTRFFVAAPDTPALKDAPCPAPSGSAK